MILERRRHRTSPTLYQVLASFAFLRHLNQVPELKISNWILFFFLIFRFFSTKKSRNESGGYWSSLLGELSNGRKVSFTICYAEIANSNQKVELRYDELSWFLSAFVLLANSQFIKVHQPCLILKFKFTLKIWNFSKFEHFYHSHIVKIWMVDQLSLNYWGFLSLLISCRTR